MTNAAWGIHNFRRKRQFQNKRNRSAPGKRLSFQSRRRRLEHWFGSIVKVTLNDREIIVKTGEAVDIRVGDCRRVVNSDAKKLSVFIETQPGDYFGEEASNATKTISRTALNDEFQITNDELKKILRHLKFVIRHS